MNDSFSYSTITLQICYLRSSWSWSNDFWFLFHSTSVGVRAKIFVLCRKQILETNHHTGCQSAFLSRILDSFITLIRRNSNGRDLFNTNKTRRRETNNILWFHRIFSFYSFGCFVFQSKTKFHVEKEILQFHSFSLFWECDKGAFSERVARFGRNELKIW